MKGKETSLHRAVLRPEFKADFRAFENLSDQQQLVADFPVLLESRRIYRKRLYLNPKTTNIMASQIKDTPILVGDEAKRFRRELRATLLKELTPEEMKSREEEDQYRTKCYELMVSLSHGEFY